MTTPIPIHVLEAVTGALLAAFVIKGLFMVWYLRRAWRERHLPGVRFYSYENKAALAMAMIASGMSINVFSAWWSIHLRLEQEPRVSVWLTVCYIFGGLCALWGLLCLLRALSRYDWPRWIWPALVAVVVAFGVVSAVMPNLLPM